MLQALGLAERSIGLSDPNPRVGCVIGRDDGSVIATGWTQRLGGLHAEAMAIADAKARGNDLNGATAWVTLEPCAHQGRTPPCANALVDAGIARVVVAITDPFPAVAGAGMDRMRHAGIHVGMAEGDLATLAHEMNIGYFSRVLRKRPWVRMKIAASLDGSTALLNGASQWITGPEARLDGHLWRKRSSAVLTGIGTVLADDPRMDVRLVSTDLQPMRVVVDSRLRILSSARILSGPGPCVVATAVLDQTSAAALGKMGIEVIALPNANGQVDINALLNELAQRGVNELHIEAGARLNGDFLKHRLVDELLVYLAPKIIGPGHAMSLLAPIQALSDCVNLTFTDISRLGADVRIRALVASD